MKTGIVIIFHNYELGIDKTFFKEFINASNNVEICLVNNNSNDNTYEISKEISMYCENVSVLNINSFKDDIAAIRSGVRYLVNQFNLKHIGYINTNTLKSNKRELNAMLKAIVNHHDEVLNFKDQVSQQKKIKASIFQNVFSLLECFYVFNRAKSVIKLQN